MNLSKNLSFLLMVLVSALLIAINYYTIQITSAVRAYINGESLYSKGQKDASRNLILFLSTSDTTYSYRFTQDIAIPIGDRNARLGLISDAVEDSVKANFIRGNNHPDDVPSMIWLFKNFGEVSFMHRAIEIWTSADEDVKMLDRMHDEIFQKVQSSTLLSTEKAHYLSEIDIITSRLTVKEREFSNVLGGAARRLNTFLFLANIVLILAIISAAWKFWGALYKRLQTTNLHLQKTLQFGKMGSAVMDYQTKRVTLSDEFMNILDLPKGANNQITIEEFVNTYVIPEDRNLVLTVTNDGKVADDKTPPTTIQYRIITAAGNAKLLDAQGFFSDKNVFAIFKDITALRKIERETIENEKRLKYILNGLPVAVYLTDETGKLTFYNEAATRLWERSPDLSTEMWCGSYKLFTADGTPLNHDECPMAVSVKTHSPVRNVEAKLATPDGTVKDFIAYTTPIWNGLNAFAGAMNVMVDISERKKSERELRSRKQFLSTLIDNVPGVVYQHTLHPNASMKYISPQIENMTGYSAEEFLSGRITPNQVIDHRDRLNVKSQVLSGLYNDAVYDIEYRIHTKDGSVRWVWEKGRGVKDSEGKVLYLEGFVEDITQQKNNALALKESEARFRGLVRNLSVGIIVFNAELKVELVNSAFAGLLGLSEQFLHRTVYWDVFEVFNENGVRMLLQDFPAAIVKRTSEPVYGFTMGIDTGKERIWVIVDSIPVFQEDGTIRQIVSTFTDITEKIRSAEKEKEISTRLVLATSAAHVGIWDWNIETGISIWSDYMFEIFGITRDEYRDNHAMWWQCIHPEDLTKVDADLKFALTTGHYNSEYRIVRPDGSVRYVKGKGIVHRNNEGKPQKMIGVDWDITKERLYETAIRESEGRFRHVADSAPVLIWMTGLDKMLNYFNKTWLEFRGRNLAEEVDDAWMEGIHDNDRDVFFAVFFDAFDRRVAFQCTLRLKNFKGEYRWLHVHGVPRFDAQSNFLGYIGSCNDVHQSVEMAAKLSENQLQLEELLEEKDMLIREIHHRVKNNLQVMSSVLFLKAQTLKDPSMRMLLTESRQRLRSMAMIHERLMQSGGQITQINIRDYLTGLIHEQRQALSIDPEYISVDVEVEEYMMNLDQVVNIGFIINETMTNAVKHAFPVQKNGRIKVFFGHTNNRLELKISDNGVGLPAHVSLNNTSFFGIQLIKVFTNHLGGEVSVNTANGTSWTINFN